MRCDVCSRDCVVTLQHVVRIGRRTVTWIICVRCELKERADA